MGIDIGASVNTIREWARVIEVGRHRSPGVSNSVSVEDKVDGCFIHTPALVEVNAKLDRRLEVERNFSLSRDTRLKMGIADGLRAIIVRFIKRIRLVIVGFWVGLSDVPFGNGDFGLEVTRDSKLGIGGSIDSEVRANGNNA